MDIKSDLKNEIIIYINNFLIKLYTRIIRVKFICY